MKLIKHISLKKETERMIGKKKKRKEKERMDNYHRMYYYPLR